MKAPKQSKTRRWVLWLAILALASWILFWGGYSFLKVYKLDREVSGLERDLKAVKALNDSLAKENARLKTDPSAAEEVAREEFGLIKPNETVWRFREAPPSAEPKK